LRRLLITFLTAGALGAFAVPALAGQVNLWVCHGPTGQPLGTTGLAPSVSGGASAQGYFSPSETGACSDASTLGSIGNSGTAGAEGSEGVAATFGSTTPADGASAFWRVAVPGSVTLNSVMVDRSTTGLGGTPAKGADAYYSLSTSNGPIESGTEGSHNDFQGVITSANPAGGTDLAAGASWVQFGVSCPALGQSLNSGQSCAAPANSTTVAAFADAIELTVTQPSSQGPSGAVGGLTNPSPSGGSLNLSIRATDPGLGLQSASVQLGGSTVASLQFGLSGCQGLDAAGSTPVDLPYNDGCPDIIPTTDTNGADAGVFPSIALPSVTTNTSEPLVVTVTDAAGNTTTLINTTLNIQPGSSGQASQSLTVGNNSSGSNTSTTTVTPLTTTTTSTGGVAGQSSTTVADCVSPQLSVKLAAKVKRNKKTGADILLKNGRYTFTGKLTCVVNGVRKAAPQNTVVRIFNVIKGHSTVKTGASVAGSGAISVILAYPTSRTLEFSYKSLVTGTIAQINFKLDIVKKKKK